MTSQRFAAVLFGLALVLGLLSALDVVAPDTGDGTMLTTAEAARSGAWTCAAPGLSPGEDMTLVAAGAPPGLREVPVEGGAGVAVAPTEEPSDPSVETGTPAEVTYDRFLVGRVERVARETPFAEQATDTKIAHPSSGGLGELGVAARWRRQPAAVGRVWERSAEFGPAGLLAAPCVAGSSAKWIIPGLSTAGGAEASLVLSNPFASDASVTITLAGDDGPEQPSLLENVVVPAQSVRLLALNEHAPERRDVGIVVNTRSGRVIVEALQSVNAAIGGIEGVTLVRAATEAGSSWTIPWVPTTPASTGTDGEQTSAINDEANTPATVEGAPEDVGPSVSIVQDDGLGGDASSWVWVTNADVDDAVLLVTVHGPRGGELLELEGLEPLAPGAVVRIELDGLTRERRSAVTVATENGAAIVASVGTQIASGSESRTGISVQLGAATADPVWVLPGEGVTGRQQLLSLVNPGGEPAVVALSFWGATGIERPASAQAIEVPPGTTRTIELGEVLDPEQATSVVFVQTLAGSVVAGRLSFADEGRLDLVVNVGLPSALWRGGTLVPVTRFDPYLTGEVPPRQPQPLDVSG